MLNPSATPRIGVTMYREPASWLVWRDKPADLLTATYTDAVVTAGGMPLLLPPVRPELAATALDGLDGLLLSGGPDVDPAHYGAPRDPATWPPRPERDAWELALVRAAVHRDLPVLGICRGLQLLNVALGGTLVQDLPAKVGTSVHNPHADAFGLHEVVVAESCRLAGLFGPRPSVPTYHHQAVDVLGNGLVATAWAGDGTVEAIEHRDRTWVAAVQWHPEVSGGGALFAAFVRAARQSRQ